MGVEGVERMVRKLEIVTPKNIVDSITKELDWGTEKLRDDITCLALDIKNTELKE
jgi:adenylate cyclase